MPNEKMRQPWIVINGKPLKGNYFDKDVDDGIHITLLVKSV